jgi:hypothetical protein
MKKTRERKPGCREENVLQEYIREILAERRKKKKKKKSSASGPYQKGTPKNLYLDRPTSHGGWPEGPSKSYTSDKPVNQQISDWLKSMSMTEQADPDASEIPRETTTQNGNLIFTPPGLTSGSTLPITFFYPGVGSPSYGEQPHVAKMIKAIGKGGSKSRIVILARNHSSDFADLEGDIESFLGEHNLNQGIRILGGWSAGARGVKKALRSSSFDLTWLADPEVGSSPESRWPELPGNIKMIYANPGAWGDPLPSWQDIPWLVEKVEAAGGKTKNAGESHSDIAKSVLSRII